MKYQSLTVFLMKFGNKLNENNLELVEIQQKGTQKLTYKP